MKLSDKNICQAIETTWSIANSTAKSTDELRWWANVKMELCHFKCLIIACEGGDEALEMIDTLTAVARERVNMSIMLS